MLRKRPIAPSASCPIAASLLAATPVRASGAVTAVVVNQAGYSADAYKVAYISAIDSLSDPSHEVDQGLRVLASGTAVDNGVTWGMHVYPVGVSAVTTTGSGITVTLGGASSYPFEITSDNTGDITCTHGKDHTFTANLVHGNHSFYFRTTDTTSDVVATATVSGPVVS